MDSRRMAILKMEEPAKTMAILKEIDIMAEKIADQCNEHFDAVVIRIDNSQKAQINAIQELSAMTREAINGTTANLKAINDLTESFNKHKESLAITAGVESAGKNSVGFIKEAGIKLKEFLEWLKGSVGGILAVTFLFFLLTGRISFSNISDVLTKVIWL